MKHFEEYEVNISFNIAGEKNRFIEGSGFEFTNSGLNLLRQEVEKAINKFCSENGYASTYPLISANTIEDEA